ncbi:MAG: DUF5615 family PIN-like protein [Acidobacteria bacterium]|nr:DUF5615 family PIN-like protein [Acidobacteriota bacterium]MCA1649803.1 DUF5615 family PIN-like protein [Acidobacteriota bacterium]
MTAVKLDENVPDSVATVLRQAGHNVALARDEQLVGANDEHLLNVAASEGRVFVTLDLHFTDIRRHPPQATPGIVVLRPHAQTLPLIRHAAVSLAALLLREPIMGRLWVIDDARLRIWPGASTG